MSHANRAAPRDAKQHGASPKGLAERFVPLTAEALSFAPRDKADHTARQWLSVVPFPVTEEYWSMALGLALELTLITPSLSGATAFDRLARAMRGRPPGEIEAVTVLCRSRFRLMRLSGARFEDLTNGETGSLAPSPLSAGMVGEPVFGRFADLADGELIAAGVLVPVDDAALALARGFFRPGGRGPSNPVRCAEAVYRQIIRHGLANETGQGPGATRPAKLPFDPDRNPLDALAAAWAARPGEPGPEEIARARGFVGPGTILDALVSVVIARDGGAKALAEAYRRIAAVLVDTMAVREAHGSARAGLDRIAAEIEAAIKRGDYPPEVRTMFAELRERARLAGGRPEANSGDLDRLVQRIRALREKTVEQGCTEQEALAAAEKVAELLDRYGLSLSELDLRKQSCEGIGVETNRKRRGPIDDCMADIADFFDCRVWGETAETGELRYIFFGLPADVQAAVYLHDLIALAFATETATFRDGEFYRDTHTGQRRSATNSFQLGLARGIVEKLRDLRRTRDAAGGATNGRALVPVKDSIIDQEMERLGLVFKTVGAARRKVIPDAYSAGREAGERFDYRPGITDG